MKASMIACRVRSLRKRRPATLGSVETKLGSVAGMKGYELWTGAEQLDVRPAAKRRRAGRPQTYRPHPTPPAVNLQPSHTRRMAGQIAAIKLQVARQIAAKRQILDCLSRMCVDITRGRPARLMVLL